MAAKRSKSKGKSNRGGARAGAGRKPKATTEMKQRLISEMAEVSADTKNDAAVYAFGLFDKTMRDEKEGIATRLECATEVLNRVWGKPKQAVEMSGPGGGAIPMTLEARIEHIYRKGAAT
jgi:phenylpyruvate tautomerase PptA (4-oxalocrotonate tautomerase family)